MPAAVDGVPVTLIDTAAVRVTDDGLECEAISAGRRQTHVADLVVFVYDGRQPPDAMQLIAGTGTCGPRRWLIVANKADLGPALPLPPAVNPFGLRSVEVSARTGEGVEGLGEALLNQLCVPPGEAAFDRAFLFDRQLRRRLEDLVCDIQSPCQLATRLFDVVSAVRAET